MRKTVLFIAIFSVLGAGLVFPQPATDTKDSFSKALAVVERSYDAMGGAAAIDAVNDISFALAGTIYARNQSRRPDTEFDPFPIETKIQIDLKKDRVSWEQRSGLPGGLLFVNKQAGNLESAISLDLTRKTHTKLQANTATIWLAYRLVTPYFLKKALEQRGTLRYGGTVNVGGRAHELVYLYWRSLQYALYFDKESNLLTKHEMIFPDATTGVDLIEFYYSDYQKVAGMMMPTKYRQIRSGKLTRESTLSDIKVNQGVTDAVFELPADYPVAPSTPFAIKELSKNAWLVDGVAGGGYRQLVVAFKDHLLVVDAPGNSGVSAQTINEIKKAIPGKPIKYIVPTHFHDDHTGGIRGYIAEGAQVVTTKSNQVFFEKFAAAEYYLTPDALMRKPAKPQFMFIDDNHKFTDGETIAVVRKINNPHAEEIFLVYLPAEKIVFQSDLYNQANNAVTDSTVDMVKQIEKFGWEVETVIGSHSGAVPFAQIKQEVEAFKTR